MIIQNSLEYQTIKKIQSFIWKIVSRFSNWNFVFGNLIVNTYINGLMWEMISSECVAVQSSSTNFEFVQKTIRCQDSD